ncbi:SGNH/GDSL hydrolase family protein [bacterium]|nr:MAG: SGNH/GDSL hydrolase family protein [bacterium]
MSGRNLMHNADISSELKSENSLTNKILLRLIIIILSIIICFLFIEIVFRLFYPAKLDRAQHEKNRTFHLIKPLLEPSDDPTIGYELKRNADIEWLGCRVITDENGCRIGSSGECSRTDGVRIAVVGDSTAFGWGVNFEHTIGTVFCCEMNKITTRPVGMRNYAVPGYNSEQEMQIFRTRTIDFKPDLIILMHDHNDTLPVTFMSDHLSLHPEIGDNFFHSDFIRFLIRRYILWRYKGYQRVDPELNKYTCGYNSSGPLYDDHIDILYQFNDLAIRRKIPVIFISFFAFPDLEKESQQKDILDNLHNKLKQRLRKTEFFYFDTYPIHLELMQRNSWKSLKPLWIRSSDPIDVHPNAAGHMFLAGKLKDFVLNNQRLKSIFLQK